MWEEEKLKSNNIENPLSILDNIEEDDEPLDFWTCMKLHEIWKVQDLEENFDKEEIEEKPLIANVKELEITAIDTKGEPRKLYGMTKGVIREQKLPEIKRNPDLKFLSYIGHSKVYYNIPNDEFWIEVYEPSRIKGINKKTMIKIGSIKLEDHDFETMYVLSLLYNRNFPDSLPQTVYVRNKDHKKAKEIIEKWNS